ncbi:MAG: alpha/beta fold hydrolase [Sphingobacteriaceae bacterium]
MKKVIFHIRVLLIATIVLLNTTHLQAQFEVTQTNKMKSLKASGKAAVNGLQMYYEIHGEGKPIVLLHGSYMTIDLNWGSIIPELAKTHKVIAVEMQGHGRTADIDRKPSYKAMAEDVSALLKHLKLNKASVLGYSLGGTVAIQFAISHPEQLDKLVLISTVSKHNGWSKATRDILKTMKPEFLSQTPLKTEYDKVAPKPGDWNSFLTKFIEFDNQDFDLGDNNIKNIKAPVLMIMGDNDGVTLEHKTELYKLLGGDVFADMNPMPKSLLAIFPGSSHVGLMMQSDKILDTVIPFIQDKPFSPVMPGQ